MIISFFPIILSESLAITLYTIRIQLVVWKESSSGDDCGLKSLKETIKRIYFTGVEA